MDDAGVSRELPHQATGDLINLRLMLQQIHSPSEEINKAKTALDKHIATQITNITKDKA